MSRRIGYAYGLQTAPTAEPITVDDAKLDRRMTGADEDGAVDRWIRSARGRSEHYLGRGLLTQTWKYQQDEFTDEIVLPMAAPLQSVQSVKYYDTNGTLQTLSASIYLVDTLSEPGRVVLAPNQVWPAIQSRPLAVEVNYTVGWTSVENIPPEILDGLHLWIGDRDAFRESMIAGTIIATIPNSAEAFLAPHRRWWREPKAAC